ncbi:MAG: hypothetical protein J4F41_07695 [Alphaproteobacteria bacterium]|nr:hypothetical protein [Alphaproteobacteria bacterium]
MMASPQKTPAASPQHIPAVLTPMAALAELERRGVTPATTSFVLAVSGGPDSMAMAPLLHQWWQDAPSRQSLLAVAGRLGC